MKPRYVIRPQADRDLDEQALYLSREASLQTGHRFLVAAHETFTRLASQPNMGWRFRGQKRLINLRVFPVSGFDRMLILYLPLESGVEILRVIHGSRDIQMILRREPL